MKPLPSSLETPLQLLEKSGRKLIRSQLTAEQLLEVQLMLEELAAIRDAATIWFAHYSERDPVDGRFAPRDVVLDATPCVPARIPRPDDDSPCPVCAHRLGGHGIWGCMHIVSASDRSATTCSCKVVRE